MQLPAPELRVLASLIEKEAAVPDSYPMTLTALRLACNQSTNRRPVVAYDDRTVEASLLALKSVGLVRFLHPSHGGRTVRYRHTADERWRMSGGELLALSALALRGPQTANEVRARIERLLSADDDTPVEALLDTLAARSPEPFAARLERQSGERDVRWISLLGGDDPHALDDELADSTSDLPRRAPSWEGAGDGARGNDDTAPWPAPTREQPVVDDTAYAALAERVEELSAVIGAVAARLERLEGELGMTHPR